MRSTTLLLIVMLLCCTIRANTGDSLSTTRQPSLQYKTGTVNVAKGIAQITIPPGFKFLDAEQSKYIISDVWRQSPQPDLAGMLLPETANPLNKNAYAVVINYEPRGMVKDGDANRIDYDRVLQNLQRDETEENAERKAMGYAAVHLIGWIRKPVYDKTYNELYWARELQVGNEHMVSYHIRVLGRQGILSMNAESSINNQALLINDMSKVLHTASFTEGNRYVDFNSKTDKVALWTVGTLVTGKIVDQTRIFALLGKYLNLIVSWLVVVIVLISNLLKPGLLPTHICDVSLNKEVAH